MLSCLVVAKSVTDKNIAGSLLLFGFLLLVISAQVYALLQNLAEKDRDRQTILAKERLINEMNAFQESLKPEAYLERSLAEYEKQFFSTNSFGFVNREFFDSILRFLQIKCGIRPFLFIAGSHIERHIYSRSNPGLFADDEEDSFAVQVFHFYHNLSQRPQLVNGMRVNDRAIFTSKATDRSIKELFLSRISRFSDITGNIGHCSSFFSIKSGRQRSYQFAQIISDGVAGPDGVKGFYYLCCDGMDFSPKKMLSVAIKSDSSVIERSFAERSASKPGFVMENGWLSYLAPFPQWFFTAVEDYGLRNPKGADFLRKAIRRNILKTSLNTDFFDSAYDFPLKALAFWCKLLFLMLFTGAIHLCVRQMPLELSLSRKLRIAVAFAVILPVLGICAVSVFIDRESVKLVVNICQNKMRQRL
ncbi:MAG: hypothetical protein AB1403_01850, partial [Candidatus Riflebacteria bacterium]